MKVDMKKYKKILYYLSILVLLMCHFLILFLIHRRMPHLLDSDMSSEMVLGKLLSEENAVISKNWFYSTELRVINTQLVYSLFFHFTDNWHVVRLLSDIVLHGLLSFSCIFFCHKAGIGKYGFGVAICTIVPISIHYFLVVTMGCYYIPHIVIGFFTLALVYCYSDVSGKKKRLPFVLAAFLSFIAGLGGIRQLVITYIPLFLAAVVLCFVKCYESGWGLTRKSVYFYCLKISATCLATGGIGFVINDLKLSSLYNVYQWESFNFKMPQYDQLRTVVNDILTTFGFVSGQITFKTLLSNGACALIIVLIVWSIITGLSSKASEKLKFYTVFYICDVLVFLALFIVTDMTYTIRYNIPVLVFTFPLIALSIHEADFGKLPQISRQILTFIFIGMIILRGGYQYSDLMNPGSHGVISEELIETAGFLKDSEYKNGYATFWNANILTEISNGELNMYVWKVTNDDGTDFNKVRDIDHLFSWLQSTKHIEIKPQGKVFALYKKNEVEHCNWKQGLDDSDILFKTSHIVVYGYDSYSEMKEACKVADD